MYSPDTNPKDELHPASYFRLLWLSLVLVLPALIYGLNQNLPTVALPLLNLSISTASWLGSVGIYACPIGTILSSIVIDTFGRKPALIFGIVPSLVGWSLLYWNPSETILLLGQAINGFSIGSLLYPIHVNAGECIPRQNVRFRNNFMVYVGLFSSLGTVVIIFFSNFLNYSQICAMALTIVTLIMLIFVVVIPESPVWLHLQGRLGDAEWSEKKLGIAQPILHKTQSKVKLQPASEWSWSSFSQSLQKLKRPDVYKPLYICSIAQMIMPANGALTIMAYMINIIDDSIPGQMTKVNNETTVSSSVPFDAHQLSLFCSLFAIIGCLSSTFVLSVMGIKKLFITSNVFAALSLVILTYCTLDIAVGVLQLRVLAIATVTFATGSIIGPWSTASADMFPVDSKGFYGVPMTIGSLTAATANKVFPYLYLEFGGYAYCFYAFVCLLGIIYINAQFPEVVGKTLDEINDEFLGIKQDGRDSKSG